MIGSSRDSWGGSRAGAFCVPSPAVVRRVTPFGNDSFREEGPEMIRMGPHAGRPAKSEAVEGAMEDQDAVDLAADWADISQGLRKDLGHQLFSQWIRPIQVGSFCKDTGTLHLFLPTEFSANWVQDR